jgi:two-component system response regulator ResD
MTRILVVDDDQNIRRLIRYALSDEGYQVDEASDGKAALKVIGKQHPDIIILDMKMPGMDGWEFARAYRNLYDHRAAIIVLTAARDAAARSMDINAESFLSKPFDLDILLQRVAEIRARI